jgi:hypothetical protein
VIAEGEADHIPVHLRAYRIAKLNEHFKYVTLFDCAVPAPSTASDLWLALLEDHGAEEQQSEAWITCSTV